MLNELLALGKWLTRGAGYVWEKDIIRVPSIAILGQLTAIPLEHWHIIAGIICTFVTTVYVICKIIHSIKQDFFSKGEKKDESGSD